MMRTSLYQDCDALAYKPHALGEQRGAINHIKKAKARTKGLEVTFDPAGHRCDGWTAEAAALAAAAAPMPPPAACPWHMVETDRAWLRMLAPAVHARTPARLPD